MRITTTLFALLAASPALAAGDKFFSLANTDFVVLIAFLLFVGVIVYLKVPGLLAGLLDKRAEGIESELNEARELREEAQTLLASYERKQREVQEQADRIIEAAKVSASEAAEQAKADLVLSIERRVKAAEDQIISAEKAAVNQVRDEAARIAIGAAGDVIASTMTDATSDAMIEDAIKTVSAKLH